MARQDNPMPLYMYRPISPLLPPQLTSLGPVWQGSGFSKNGFGSGSFGGVAFLMELKSFWKTFGKTASPLGLRL
jgi:hypothetical protein